MDELKPCPFCGGEAVVVVHKTDFSDNVQFAAICTKCNASTDYQDTHKEAELAWNRRAAPENKLQCDGCENQKHDGFNYEICIHCKRHWPDHYARKPEGSGTP